MTRTETRTESLTMEEVAAWAQRRQAVAESAASLERLELAERERRFEEEVEAALEAAR